MEAQAGMAFQSAANVQQNMAYTVGDIVRYVYKVNSALPSREKMRIEEWLRTQREVDFQSQEIKQKDAEIAAGGKNLQRLEDRFRLYQPEVMALADFFAQKENLAIVEKIGTELFWIDRASMQRIAEQYKENLRTAFDAKSTPDAKKKALQDLLERTKLVYRDFADLRRDIRRRMTDGREKTAGEWQIEWEKAIEDFAKCKRHHVIEKLTRLFAAGSISLSSNKAKDGDQLTLRVEAQSSEGTTSGVPAVFAIAIRKYGAKVHLGSSFLFVRRLGVRDSEANPPAGSNVAPINKINFAPSPGVTFGIAYFKRGKRASDKFLRAAAPGGGLNVTFMNFNDSSFDQATQKFVNTTGTNVQVGAGLIGSLFDNKIQISYGWNLNVDRRRTYFGVGFGFIEIGKELTKYLSK